MKNWIVALGLSLLLAFGPALDIADAKGGRSGGGSFSSSRGSSSSFGSRSSSSSFSSKPTTASSGSTTSRPTTSSSKPNSVDSKVSAGMKSTGKTFSSKQAAVSDFKAKYAGETKAGGKFSSQYKSEPAKRPDHIPATTSVGGQNVNVQYNGGMGGYGYYHPSLGTWMMYDALSDAMMMNALMHREGYVVGHHGGGTTVVHNGGYSAGWLCTIFGVIFALVVLGFTAYTFINMKTRRF